MPDLLWLAGVGLLAGLLLTVILIGRREERQAEAPRLCPVPVAER